MGGRDTRDLNMNTKLTPIELMASSCTGAFITSVFMTPFDVVKVRLQAQQRTQLSRQCFLYCNGLMDHICNCATQICNNHEHGYWYNRPVPVHLNGTVDAFIKISRSEGVQSLWSGLPPTLIVAIPNTVIYFTTYEQLRAVITNHFSSSGSPPVWAGGLSGSCARMWAVTVVSPFELVRTKMQAKNVSYTELMAVLRQQITSSGISSLWRGWVPTVLRDVPFSAFYWTSYENLKRVCNQEQPSPTFSLAAGALSGGVAGALTLPLDVVKTHRQIEIGERELFTDKAVNPGSTRIMLINIYKNYGMRGLFAGVVPRLAKVMPACAIMISSYEYAKTYLRHTQYN